MSDNAMKLLALFKKFDTDELTSTEYLCIDNYEKAIIELENDGLIIAKNDIQATIQLI